MIRGSFIDRLVFVFLRSLRKVADRDLIEENFSRFFAKNRGGIELVELRSKSSFFRARRDAASGTTP